MGTSPENRKSMQIVPPAAASHFSIVKCSTVDGHGRQTKMRGPPDDEGQVAETWPVSEFSVSKVLAAWGDGRYRVEWYGADDERIKGEGKIFEVATPAARAKKDRKMQPKRRLATGDDEPEPLERAIASGNGSVGILDMLAMLRAERDDAREQAQQQAERDRQFWVQQQASQMQMLTMIVGKGGGGGGGTDASAMDLPKRELKLAQEQGLFQLRKDLFDLKDEIEPESSDPSDTPPGDMSEAGERIGMKMMGELENAAPELVQQMLPSILSFLSGKGFKMSDELRARIEAVQNGHANGV